MLASRYRIFVGPVLCCIPRSRSDHIPNSLEPPTNLFRQAGDLAPVDKRHQCFRSCKRDSNFSISVFADHNIAWKQKTNVRIDTQGLMRQARIASPKDAVSRLVNIQFHFRDRLEINVADNPEPFLLQLFDNKLHGFIKVGAGFYRKTVCPWFHEFLLYNCLPQETIASGRPMRGTFGFIRMTCAVYQMLDILSPEKRASHEGLTACLGSHNLEGRNRCISFAVENGNDRAYLTKKEDDGGKPECLRDSSSAVQRCRFEIEARRRAGGNSSPPKATACGLNSDPHG